VRYPTLNPAILAEIARHPGATLAGSIYAVAEADRLAAAEHLAQAGLWIHADVITDDLTHWGVDLSLVRTLSERGIGPLDVHVIAPALDGLISEICAQKVNRITFPFESCPDLDAVADIAQRIRSSGAAAWLAVAPGTEFAEVRPCFETIDGLLVMLIEPGSTGVADPALAARAGQTGPGLPAGVDGGVDAANLGACLGAGASYVVSGRALLSPSSSTAADSPGSASSTPTGRTPKGT
jgi:pentose-5-phosphate-3-epimerase